MGFTGSLKRTQEEEEEVKGAPMVSHSRVHAPPPPPDMRVVRPNPLTTPDPLRFLSTMKRELANETQKYDEFIDVMGQFKDGRVDTSSLIEYVTVLLAGHPDLLRGFNEFVPWDYKISHGQAGPSDGI